ncbi:MAG: DNA-binding protein [Candidatus Riflebacteria bacterium HGW-Riflebacteria-2]|jgi:phage regulator Rha-like protein|nr:MAG: DNA-binding protein [Candidatus Riflebacteria bacterium HGW-Riflebacteria-2]
MTKTIQLSNEYLEQKIYQVRGQKVMLDSDLAELYGVETRRLNEQVRRNAERFPVSFMFQLSLGEEEVLRSQFAISKTKSLTSTEKRGGRRYATRVFTEHGVLMLANVLRSEQAIAVSVQIIEAFVRLRKVSLSYADIAAKIGEIESRLVGYDDQFKIFHEIILPLLEAPLPGRKKIGFEPG